jgi:hypothetical protein
VVDGATNAAIAGVPVGIFPLGLSVNPVTNTSYVSNFGAVATDAGTVTAIREAPVQAVPLSVSILPLAGNQTTSPAPAFAFTAHSSFSPTAPPPQNVFFQMDTVQGVWTKAVNNGPSFAGTVSSLLPGFHLLYAYADDGQAATQPNSPLVSAITAYGFLVAAQAPSITVQPASTTVTAGANVMFTVVASGAAPLSYQWLFNGSPIGGATSASYTIGSASSANAGGYTVTVTNSVGGVTSAVATLTVNEASSVSSPGTGGGGGGAAGWWFCTALALLGVARFGPSRLARRQARA